LHSRVCRRKLEVAFTDNPQKDSVDLVGSINYPNASLSTSAIDFGSVLFDTLKTQEICVSNPSKVAVKYHWDLPPDSDASPDAPFDIQPINGLLEPGEQEFARVTYFARAGPEVNAAAVMRVRGGPAESLALCAAPNSMSFSLEPREVDFGTCLYDESATRQLTLANLSKCARSGSSPCLARWLGVHYSLQSEAWLLTT
jgi:hydrocephalus-inducing protein